jgi:hypothetical protein
MKRWCAIGRGLVEWLDDERITLRKRLQLTNLALQWDRLDRDDGALLRGALLAEAKEFADLSPLEEEFVARSEENQKNYLQILEEKNKQQAQIIEQERQAARRADALQHRLDLFPGGHRCRSLVVFQRAAAGSRGAGRGAGERHTGGAIGTRI